MRERAIPPKPTGRVSLDLYGARQEINPAPVVALNHAVAVAMAGFLDDGLACMDDIGSTGA
jgi:predicted RNA polymerase sigma factor